MSVLWCISNHKALARLGGSKEYGSTAICQWGTAETEFLLYPARKNIFQLLGRLQSLSLLLRIRVRQVQQSTHLKAAATGPMSMLRRSMTEMRLLALPMGVFMPQTSCTVRRDRSSNASTTMHWKVRLLAGCRSSLEGCSGGPKVAVAAQHD